MFYQTKIKQQNVLYFLATGKKKKNLHEYFIHFTSKYMKHHIQTLILTQIVFLNAD